MLIKYNSSSKLLQISIHPHANWGNCYILSVFLQSTLMTVAKATDFISVHLLVHYVSAKNPSYFVQTVKILHLFHHLGKPPEPRYSASVITI